ncbi:chemotaxis protein CheW [Ideonella sp. YS5]|uniref:chemotaxis protein CheW n=1 Tax=Ideonella sp. YS5 TaxID=3453714 RepID=UPI003EED56CC
MNAPRELLIFDLDGLRCGLDARLVREILWLPALYPAVAAPAGVIGVFNLRGEIVPVVDPASRLKRPPLTGRSCDQIVVLASAENLVGLLVSAVRDLVPFGVGADLAGPDYGPQSNPLVIGSVQLGDDLVTLVDAGLLLSPAIALADGSGAAETGFRQDPAPAAQSVFQARARALHPPATRVEQAATALAVVELGRQYFGIEMRHVHAFCHIGTLTPIPGCPPHIAGVFGLRGQFVTLLELAPALNLPPPAGPRSKAVVGRLGEAVIGLALDDVVDVINPAAADLQPPPAELVRQRGSEIRAVTSYLGRMVVLLDLPALLAREEWLVDEKVA